MGLKRAYCTHCHTNSDRIRIFEVNPEAKVCYCPHCMAEYNPEDVIKLYNNFIQKKIDIAYKNLYEKTEFLIAYNMFAHILELDNNCIEARFGRILSLIYLSSLRRSRFSDAALLLKEESTLYFRKKQNFEAFAKFLNRASIAADEYDYNYRKRLSVRSTYYYDDECIKLMYRRVKDILEFKKYLLEETEFLYSKYEDSEVSSLIGSLKADIKIKERELDEKVLCIDGYNYGVAGFADNGAVLLGHNTKPEKINAKHFRRKSLGNEDRKVSIIRDEVFPSNVKIAHFIKKVIPWEVMTSIITIVTAIMIFLFMNKPINLVFIIACFSFFSLTAFFAIMQIVGSSRINKRRRHFIK